MECISLWMCRTSIGRNTCLKPSVCKTPPYACCLLSVWAIECLKMALQDSRLIQLANWADFTWLCHCAEILLLKNDVNVHIQNWNGWKRRLNYHQFSGKSVWTGTFAPVVRRAALISRTQREQFCRIVACSLPLLQLKCATSFAAHCCSLDLSEATRHWSGVPSEQANWTHCQTPFCNPRILTKHNKKQKTKIQTMLLSFICVQLSCAITGAIE